MNEDELLSGIMQATDASNKKQLICQCAAIMINSTKDLDESITLATKLVNKVYGETV